MFRAGLTEWAWKAAGGEGALPMPFPLAVEALHAGSLIVDDIEDGALTRRGDKALHERYGVPTALNAGNWLYFWPARLLGEAGLPPERELAALKRLADTQYQCHLGQGLDVSLKVQDIDQRDMVELVESKTGLKTGSLMGLTTYLGALAADADLETCGRYGTFGAALGNVLQMLDDAGSIACDDRDEKGREDLLTGTATWPWVWAAQALDARDYRDLVGLSHDVQAGRVEYTFLRQRLRNTLPGDLDTQLSKRLDVALDPMRNVVVDDAYVGAIYHEFDRMWGAYV
jgi:geranylgeranyl pyrophosphate synthase